MIFAKKIGPWFCRSGRTLWKTTTFGLTDMKWFYREENSPFVFRCVGTAFLVGGILFAIIVSVSLVGPGSFFAMREADAFLKEKYPDAGGAMKLSGIKQTDDATRVKIIYRYGGRSGVLRAEWDGNGYRFREAE